MNLKLAIFILGFAAADVASCFGGPALVPSKIVPSSFPGQNKLLLTWTNNSAVEINTDVDGTIFVASSALAVPLPIHLEENLRLLPNQAAFMPVTIELPEVRGKTFFVIRWQDSARNPIGKSELNVYPRDILRQLGSSVGVMSEDESFKNAFTNANLKFEEIQPDQLLDFRGQLLIVNGFAAGTNASFNAEVVSVAGRGIVVVWITPDPKPDSALQSNFFLTPIGSGAIVFVQAQFVENFAENAASQLRLIEICRAATNPGRPGLPIIFSKDQNED